MRPVIMAALLILATAAAADTPPQLVCVKQAQTDLKACQVLSRQANTDCTNAYFGAVPPCFGDNAACASQCITTRNDCLTGPRDQQTACAATCDDHSKGSVTSCRNRGGAARTCSLTSKLKSLKCKQKCARATAIPLQRCALDFGSCLKGCIPAS